MLKAFHENDYKVLEAFLEHEVAEAYSDFPIDIFLMNDDTNYVKNDDREHNCYVAKISFENLLYEQSMRHAFEMHKAYANANVGRDITVVFRMK